jgi:hypothetical protein
MAMPEISRYTMLHVTRAEYLGGYRVRLEFNDGFCGVADLAGQLTGPVFQPLNDVAKFRRFSLVGHTLCWQNGADFAPEYLRQLADEPVAEPPHTPEPAAGPVAGGEPSPPAR